MEKGISQIHIEAVKRQALSIEEQRPERVQRQAHQDVVDATRLCMDAGIPAEHVFLAAKQNAFFQEGKVCAVCYIWP